MLSNLVWGKIRGNGLNRLTANIVLSLHIIAIALAFNASTLYEYIAIFFLVGAATDANRIASGNLILILASPQKRPLYVALQINIVSLGMFFSILGGVIFQFGNYTVLYSVTLAMLSLALFMSLKLKDEQN